MIKLMKMIFGILFVTIIFFSGCGKITTPNPSLTQNINENDVQQQQYNEKKIKGEEEDKNFESDLTWSERLYVPTMIQKFDDTYFIIDCWNHRVLYNTHITDSISEWSVMTDESYIGGHTISSDGSIYVLDNTDNSEVLVYKKNQNGTFTKIRTIGNVNGRPHYVIYDDINKLFYVIGSTIGKIYVFKNENDNLVLVRTDDMPDLKETYVRSISIIDGKLYAVSGNNQICEYDIQADMFTLKRRYPVLDDFSGMNQIVKINDYFYITVNTDIKGDLAKTNIVRVKDLNNLNTDKYESLYGTMGFVGQPYFITFFDNKYYTTQISATKGNGIKCFEACNEDNISNVTDLFYWEDVLDESVERYQSKYAITEGNTETEVVDLFVFSGQSNMSGKGDAKLAPAVAYGYEYKAISDPNALYHIIEPFGINENNPEGINDIWPDTNEIRKLGGFVASFANAYYEDTSTPIVAVSCSEGATLIDDWLPGTVKYDDIISRCNMAKKFIDASGKYSLRHAYFVWCQGESDGDNGMSSEAYYQKLKSLTTSLVDNGVVEKCMIVRIGNNAKDNNLYNQIIDAQTRLCKDDNNCILISTRFADFSSAGLMKDEYHYTQEGYNLVGQEAGANAAYYSNNGVEPSIYDYKYMNEYEPD